MKRQHICKINDQPLDESRRSLKGNMRIHDVWKPQIGPFCMWKHISI